MPRLTPLLAARYRTSLLCEPVDDDPHHARRPRCLLRRGVPSAQPRAARRRAVGGWRAPRPAGRGPVGVVWCPQVRYPRGDADCGGGTALPAGDLLSGIVSALSRGVARGARSPRAVL